MLEKIIYINHVNEKIEFGNTGIYANYNDLRDYLWKYDMRAESIVKFKRETTEKSLPVVIYCESEEEGIATRNVLLETSEKDVLSKTPGTLYIGDYYLKCYIIGSKKASYLQDKRYMTTVFTLVTDHPFWCRDKTYSFYASTEQIVDNQNREEIGSILDGVDLSPEYPRDYPYGYITKYKPAKRRYLRDYAYDYYRNHTIGKLDNDHFASSAFRLIIYGPCSHPEIRIGDNLYRVSAVLYDSEYLVIDSRERTIVKYGRNGVQTNMFNARDKENYIFEKIPAGKQAVKWNAQYAFDVVLYQERSEPAWSIS
ncbi:MAG: hypothetical protein QM793_06795 [Muricomes sp.]